MSAANKQDQEFLKTLTVLYVEDDTDTREQFSEFLGRPVGRLLTAVNGAEGLELFKRHSPDIVVTDILMPVMDGLTMSFEIRAIKPSVPIIVITAFEQTDYLMRAIDIGIDKYVTKPVNSYRLFECLLECSHRLRAEEQLKLQHQHEIQAMWARQHETVAILAGGLAHDYNDLLHGLFGFASLARTKLDELDERGRQLVSIDEAYTRAEGLSSLLNILANRTEEEVPYCDVMPHIQAAIEELLPGTPVELVTDYAEGLPAVKCIKSQIHFVFFALTTNALEAMASGGTLRLSAKTTYVSEFDTLPLIHGDYLLVSLADSGNGIPADVLPKIFEPYFSTKQITEKYGMGLNLALCQTIIMKHGGVITADSTPGNGAAFHIWLPLH